MEVKTEIKIYENLIKTCGYTILELSWSAISSEMVMVYSIKVKAQTIRHKDAVINHY